MIGRKKEIKYNDHILPVILPLVMAVYILYLGWSESVASLTRIDPEYLCLLNGLNVSVLRFDNIGYTDLPGTPFLLLSGIFVRITHLLFGHGAIIDDVLTRPDFYLRMSSYMLLVITTIVLIRGGKKILSASKSVFAMLLVQSTFILSPVNLSLQVRYNADRILPLLAFIFSVYTLLYFYKNISERKFAIASGIIIGIGIITKFNFVVLAIIPLFLLLKHKTRLFYIVSFILAAFLSFLPIIDKFQNVWRFISRLLLFRGKYGGGEKGILGTDQLWDTIKELPVVNESFLAILILTMITLLLFLFIKNKKNKKEALFLLGFTAASILLVLMASKQFKNYYLAPALGLSGIALYFNAKLLAGFFTSKKGWLTPVFVVFAIALVVPTIFDVQSRRSIAKTKNATRLKTLEYANANISNNDYLFLTPAWKAGPWPVNGLMWGISYVAGKDDFAPYYLKHYPKVLSFEGRNKPIKHFRTKDADLKKVFQEQNTVYLFAGDGRNTREMMDELKSQAAIVNTRLKFDTIYANPENNDKFIKASFKKDTIDFVLNTQSFFNNLEGESENWSKSETSNEQFFSGIKSCKLYRSNKNSPVFQAELNPEQNGQLLEIQIKTKYWSEKPADKTRLILEVFKNENDKFWYPVAFSGYPAKNNEWNDFDYIFYVPADLQNSPKVRLYFTNRLKQPVYIDDINVNLVLKSNGKNN